MFGVALAPSPVPPSAPLGLRAAPGSSIGSIDLTWNAPLSDGMHAITGYDIYRGTKSGAETLVAQVGPTTTSFTDTGLTSLTTYYYDVTAINPIEGPPSNEACAVPYPSTTALPCSPLVTVAPPR